MEQAKNDQKETAMFKQVPVEALYRNPSNPRGVVGWEDVQELAESIRQYGILQPLIIQANGEIIAGERRFVAALNLGLETVPVIIREIEALTESEEIALVENIQRENLLPSVEAKAYVRMKARGLSVPQIAEKLNITETKVYQLLQLAELPQAIQDAVDKGNLPVTSIRVLRQIEDPEKRQAIIEKALAAENGLTAAEVREMAKSDKSVIAPKPVYSIIVNRAIDKIEEARLLLERFDEFKYEREDLADVKQELYSQHEKLLRIEEDIVSTMAEKLTTKGRKVTTDDFVKTDYARQMVAAG